jgi:GWxTD domain-containing protein
MRACPGALVILLAVIVSLPGLALAADLDKEDKEWLKEVGPIMVAAEREAYEKLEEKADRVEFRKIFWARRDSDLTTPENDFRAQFESARAHADREFKVPGQEGSQTDCGRTYILMGEPDDTQVQVGRSSVLYRVPEVWIYRDKPGRTFEGGEARIAFDDTCRAPRGIQQVLEDFATEKIVQTQIQYRVGDDGRLVRLEDQLPKDSPARVLLKSPREDFPLRTQTLFMRVSEEATGVVGLVRGEVPDLPVETRDGRKVADIVVATSAAGEGGVEVGWTEQAVRADVQPDGAFVASFGTSLPPGNYTFSVGALVGEGPLGALVSEEIKVPDFSRVETAADGSTMPIPSIASILFVREIEDLEPGTPADPEHPYAAFRLGETQVVPFFGSELSPTDEVIFFYLVYDLGLVPATDKGDAVIAFSILKGGQQEVASAPENRVDTPLAASAVGPVPMGAYPPGSYVAQLRVTDRVTKKTVVQNERFKIVAPEGAAP